MALRMFSSAFIHRNAARATAVEPADAKSSLQYLKESKPHLSLPSAESSASSAASATSGSVSPSPMAAGAVASSARACRRCSRTPRSTSPSLATSSAWPLVAAFHCSSSSAEMHSDRASPPAKRFASAPRHRTMLQMTEHESACRQARAWVEMQVHGWVQSGYSPLAVCHLAEFGRPPPVDPASAAARHLPRARARRRAAAARRPRPAAAPPGRRVRRSARPRRGRRLLPASAPAPQGATRTQPSAAVRSRRHRLHSTL